MVSRQPSANRLTFGGATISSSQKSSHDQSESVINSIADEVLKYKQKLEENLRSKDAISIEELQECDNLNPYRDWFVSVLADMNALQSSIGTEFINEIETMNMAGERLHDMLNQNQELELQN